jgi:hypothetical protein
MILTDRWRITCLWKIRHIARSAVSLRSFIHSLGNVWRNTIFFWFPIYYARWICQVFVFLFPKLSDTLEWGIFGNPSAYTKWGAETECRIDIKVSEILRQRTELLESQCTVVIIFAYIDGEQIVFRCLPSRAYFSTLQVLRISDFLS